MNVTSVKIGKRKFNVTQAAAVNQKKLLSLVGAKIALNSASAGVEEIDKELLFGALLSMPEDKFDEIADIVLYKTIESGGDRAVDVGDFQNGMTDYFILVAEAIVVNLQDFFTYLDSANAKGRAAARQTPVQ